MDTMTTARIQASTFLAAVAYGGSSVHAIRDLPAERAQVGIGNSLISGPALCGVRGRAGGLAWGFHLQGDPESPLPFTPDHSTKRPRTCPRCTRLATEAQQ